MVRVIFKNFKSSDEWLLDNYFKGFDKLELDKDGEEIARRAGKAYETMISEGICTEEVEVSSNSYNNTLEIHAKKRGITFGSTFTTDKSYILHGSIINPFGKGGSYDANISMDTLKKINLEISSTDRYRNKITIAKKNQLSENPQKNFHLEEENIVYTFPNLPILGSNIFSIYAGNRRSTISPQNKYPEHKSNTSITKKLSLVHQYKFFNCDQIINPSLGYFSRIQNELSVPKYSDCSFFKSNFTSTLVLPLVYGFRLHFTNNIGGIYRFNKKMMTPYSDRFFNDRAFTIEGFESTSLVTSRLNTPYLGGDYFYTSNLSLVRPFSENFNFFCFGTMGNSSLNYGNFKSSMNDLFDTKRIRGSIGAGLFIDVGQAFVKISFVKSYSNIANDSKQIYGFDFQTKF